MTAVVTLEEVVSQAKRLSPADQVRLIQQVAEYLAPSIPPQVEQSDGASNGASRPSWLPPLQEISDEEYEREMEVFDRFLEENAMDTGIPDLAYQHDHYRLGTPKKPNPYLKDKSETSEL